MGEEEGVEEEGLESGSGERARGGRDVVKGSEGEGSGWWWGGVGGGWWGCPEGKREWVKPGEMKSRPQGERRERERARDARRSEGRWTAGDEDNVAKQRGKER